MEVLPISGTSPEINEEDRDRRSGLSRFKIVRRPDLLFLVVVVVPVLASILYFGLLASDIYISESRFVVRAPEKPAPIGLGAILQSAGFSNATDEVSAAQSYAVSRDALRAINKGDTFEKAYTRPGISMVDRFNPFGLSGSFEELYRYFQSKVSIQNDAATSITTLTVRAYTPQDARRFNQELLELSEATVNRLNLRGREDLVRFAQSEVDQAKARATDAAVALAGYRKRSGIVDPEKQADAQMQMISNLQNQLIAGKTQLAQLEKYAPENPQIPVVRTQIAAVQQQIDQEEGKVTGNRRSLAGSAVQFQRLTVENDFATQQLAAALASLEQARNEARKKQAYVERIVEPNVPDSPMEPRRLRGIFTTLVLSLIAYGILRMLLAGVKEHAQ
jgi:capsular polysaccharide transport system permease protein